MLRLSLVVVVAGSECDATVPFFVVPGMMVSLSLSVSVWVWVLGLGLRPRFLGSGIFEW